MVSSERVDRAAAAARLSRWGLSMRPDVRESAAAKVARDPRIAVHVINLESDRDRLDWMRRQFSDWPCEIIRIPARAGRELGPQELDKHRAADSPDMTANEIGCIESHIRALREFLSGGCDQALILEDDVHVSPAAAQILQRLIEYLPDFPVIKLEATPMGIDVSAAAARIDGFKLHLLKG
jgi:glycosyl transferase, family 25